MTPTKTIGKYRWTICTLLFLATTINYLDRQVLSLLHPILEEEFGWSNTDYANITAVFQFAYAISMVFAGRIIDKLGTKWGYALALILWSVAAALHAYALPIGDGVASILTAFGISGVSVSVMGFIVVRGLLGVGEAGNFPAAVKATAEYFPKKERSFATGIFNSGTTIGAVLAPLTVPIMAQTWGWQSTFIAVGLAGLLWLILWFIFYQAPEKQKRLSKEEYDYIHSDDPVVPAEGEAKTAENVVVKRRMWAKLLTYRQTWVFAVGKLITDGVWWFFLFWLPSILHSEYGMSTTDMMVPLAVLYALTMIGSIGGGWFPTHFINKGYNAYEGRMKAMLIIAFIPLVVLGAQPLGEFSYWWAILLIGIGASAHQAWSANLFTIASDLFPTKSVGSVTGIGGMLGGIGSALFSKSAGALFDYYEGLNDIHTGYTIMFAVCAFAYLFAWVLMKLLVPKMKVVDLDA